MLNKKNKTLKNKILVAVLSGAATCFSLIGCGNMGKVVFTAGFSTNEVFYVGNATANTTEMLLYLTNITNQYNAVYGDALWEMGAEEEQSLTDRCKDIALAELSQLKAMNLLAREYNISLTEEEKAQVTSAAEAYMATLTDTEKEALGLQKADTVETLYEEKLIADKLYAYLIRDVNPEISDDEARIVTVQHILLKTYTVDEYGNRQEMSDYERGKVYEKAEEIRQMALDGESFDTLISKYSEDSKGTYSFGKGEMEESFETAAFSLATDEISAIVSTSHGYHIIKCISTLDRDQTDLNKQKLLISRKQQVFGDTYNTFISELDKQANTELIQSLTVPDYEEVDTAEFFAIYDEMLGSLYK